MALYAPSVKEFVQDAYQLSVLASPTVPLHGRRYVKGR